jgi:hypothetical protein
MLQSHLHLVEHNVDNAVVGLHKLSECFAVVLEHVVLQIANECRPVVSKFIHLSCELGGREVDLDLNNVLLVIWVCELSSANKNLVGLQFADIEEWHPGLRKHLVTVLLNH